jgi:hypothetical protein
MANRAKESIVSALKSVESTLKTILKTHTGAAKELFVQFREAGYMDDIPQHHAKAISASVLPGIAVLRNELGGHGQGSDVISVPMPYASLSVHLAAAINLFLTEQSVLATRPPAKPLAQKSVVKPKQITDDDAPF